MKKRKIKFHPLKWMGDLVVYVYASILTVPLFFAFITAFKSESERVLNPIGLPESWGFENFMYAITEGNLLVAAKNSIIISVASTLLLMANVVLVSYCMNRIRDTKVGFILYMLLIVKMFIPGVGTVTTLMMRRDLGLYNNLFGEIFIGALAITNGVFLVSGFLRTIPRDLEEAAMLDGASDFQICTKVILPVITPIVVSQATLSFTHKWNSTLGPLLTLRDEKLFTIPMVLYLNFTSETSIQYTKLFAGVLITSIPLIILYIKAQKYFVSAIAGSVKG